MTWQLVRLLVRILFAIVLVIGFVIALFNDQWAKAAVFEIALFMWGHER